MKKQIPIGQSDFKEVREGNFCYVDKTLLAEDVINSSGKVLLFPRPRRFGKTLNLSMLRYFFERTEEDTGHLFKDTLVSHTDVFQHHQGKYPVIWLTFKDIKVQSWEQCRGKMTELISDTVIRLVPREETDNEKFIPLHRIRQRKADMYEYENALKYLSEYLSSEYGENAVILIDEYDTPVHAAWENGYYGEIISFMRNFLGGGLKDNSHLFKGVITGILRIAKESVFSDLNNLRVYSILDRQFAASFGFTEEEVKTLLDYCGIPDHYETVSRWYNGYLFGGRVIYNPWSVLNYTDTRPEIPEPYWVNTGGTGMIDRLATQGGRELREEIGLLLEGHAICKPVYESIVIRDLEKRDDLLWSFLLFSGYLKAERQIDYEKWELKIPNREVHVMYREMVKRWFSVKTESARIENMLSALKQGDAETFEFYLADTVERVLSVHDTGGPEPEKFYHAFVLGLLVWLEGEYDIRSNRESGLGRYDVMLLPRDRSRYGIVMEFKKVNERKKETPEQTLEKAVRQMEEKKYATELQAAGVNKILKLAIAFQGRELWVRQG
ncbi:MAG: AAA family ATPase [Desulfococcaceae bacterium]|nr:AAA family ATPase [Desulfococcaceae bacterium]